LALPTIHSLPECEACLDDTDTCFNYTLSKTLTIKNRGLEYIDLGIEEINKKYGRGTVVELSYIVASTQGDTITVEIENGKDQYILESRDGRVTCSGRQKLKFYSQSERLSVFCHNLHYNCEIMFEIVLNPLQNELEDNKKNITECAQCAGGKDNACFESIYLPVHSWYYWYYDGIDGGTLLDFMISSHKKDSMRTEVQRGDGLFYLVSTRRDKVRCSDIQENVYVRWKSLRIAVYCYNNYKGCRFSIYTHATPMNKNKTIPAASSSRKITEKDNLTLPGYSQLVNNIDKIIGYNEPTEPKWSEWSEWSDCEEYREGMGRRTRTRTCLYSTFDFVHPEKTTNLSERELDQLLKSSNYSYCEGPSVDYQHCPIETMENSWQNILILIFIISSLIITFFMKKKPTRPTIDTSHNTYTEDIIKTINISSPSENNNRGYSSSETSPLLNTYFRRYD